MELAIILVLLVVVELALTFYLLARIRDYRRRVTRLEKNTAKMAEVINGMALDAKAPTVPAEHAAVQDILQSATPEDIEQAKKIIDTFGLGRE